MITYRYLCIHCNQNYFISKIS